jgi:hypothetical protein
MTCRGEVTLLARGGIRIGTTTPYPGAAPEAAPQPVANPQPGDLRARVPRQPRARRAPPLLGHRLTARMCASASRTTRSAKWRMPRFVGRRAAPDEHPRKVDESTPGQLGCIYKKHHPGLASRHGVAVSDGRESRWWCPHARCLAAAAMCPLRSAGAKRRERVSQAVTTGEWLAPFRWPEGECCGTCTCVLMSRPRRVRRSLARPSSLSTLRRGRACGRRDLGTSALPARGCRLAMRPPAARRLSY